MKTKDTVMKYKSQIISVVIGALLSGVVSLSVGLYNLSASFNLSQTKERRSNLRYEGAILKKVERELDHNLSLLLNENLLPTVDFKKVEIQLPDDIQNPDLKVMLYEMLYEFKRGLFSVTNAYVPDETFQVTAWPFGVVATEIDFDLCEDIHALYLLLDKINKAIMEIDFDLRSSGWHLGMAEVQRIKDRCEIVDDSIKKVQKEKILGLKNRVTKERQRIETLLSAMSK